MRMSIDLEMIDGETGPSVTASVTEWTVRTKLAS